MEYNDIMDDLTYKYIYETNQLISTPRTQYLVDSLKNALDAGKLLDKLSTLIKTAHGARTSVEDKKNALKLSIAAEKLGIYLEELNKHIENLVYRKI
jgi:thymidine phosphorylase